MVWQKALRSENSCSRMVFVAPQRILNAKRTLIERKVNALQTQSERNCGWTDFFQSGVLFVSPLSKRLIITKWSDNYHSSGVPGMDWNWNLSTRPQVQVRKNQTIIIDSLDKERMNLNESSMPLLVRPSPPKETNGHLRCQYMGSSLTDPAIEIA